MKTRCARLQFQSQSIAPTLVGARRAAVVFSADNLESLNYGKVMVRLWRHGRWILLLGARPQFHHYQLPDARKLHPIRTDGNTLARAATRLPMRRLRAQK
jgi:hypothetical protein